MTTTTAPSTHRPLKLREDLERLVVADLAGESRDENEVADEKSEPADMNSRAML